jgi:hypothetical protein
VQVQEDVAEDEGRPRAVGGRRAGPEGGIPEPARRGLQVVDELAQRVFRGGGGGHACTLVPAGTVAPSSMVTIPPLTLTLSQGSGCGAGPRVTSPSALKREP